MATAEVHGFIGNKFGYEVGLAALKAWMQEIGLPFTIFSTFALDFLRSVYGKDSYKGPI